MAGVYEGLIALSPKNESTFLAYPTTSEGRGIVTIKCYETGSVVNIDAHESAVAQIVLNLDGSLVATCSQKVCKPVSSTRMRGRSLSYSYNKQ